MGDKILKLIIVIATNKITVNIYQFYLIIVSTYEFCLVLSVVTVQNIL